METLEKRGKRIKHASFRDRVRRMETILNRCEEDIKDFFEFLEEKLYADNQEEEAPQQGTYMPDNTPLRNSPRLTLDYCNPNTNEGKLKLAVLKPGQKRVIAVIAYGKGGVGKTCSMRGLTQDEDIRKRFPGGLLYLSLGKESNMPTLTEGIRRIIRKTGGCSVKTKFADVLVEASVWFREQTCLFLVDDIWWVNGIDSDVLTALCEIMNEESRVVFTSRDKRFLEEAEETIEFLEMEARSGRARQMLLNHAEWSALDNLTESNENAVLAILDKCQGLPLALAIAGSSVRNNKRMMTADNKQNAWSDFYEEMLARPTTFIDIQHGKQNLPHIVEGSLAVLGHSKEVEKYKELFSALCVLQKQQSVPVHMLQMLWNLKTFKDAERIARKFDTVSVVELEKKQGCLWMRVHDLVLDIASHEASIKNQRQTFFRALALNYVPNEPKVKCHERFWMSIVRRLCSLRSEQRDAANIEPLSARAASLISSCAWWDVADDGYLHDNICYVLRQAGYVDELKSLLSKPQWIAKRLVSSGIYGVESDVEQVKTAVQNQSRNDEEYLKHLKVVAQAARMSYSFVSENPYEVWFQLYGRLQWYAGKCDRTQRFVHEIDRCAPRPWARASAQLLQPAGSLGLDVVYAPGEVYSVSEDNGRMLMVWVSSAEAGVTEYTQKNGIRRTQRIVFEEESRLYSAKISPNQQRVATGHRNGKINISERKTGRVTETLVGHTGAVLCVAWSADGRGLVSGSSDGTVRMWDTHSGEALGQPLVGHTEAVWCVAWSADGRRLVSGSSDGTVRMWDTHSGEALGQPLVGHTDTVWCVAWSADGRRLVSGSLDGTVRMWDAHSGEALGQPLVGHTGAVRCVAWSADGRRLVSGSSDGTVRMWDAHSGEALGQPLVGHTGAVRCVAWSADGRRLVSVSLDGTVRMWDAHSGEALGQPLVGHTGAVRCVAWSADGRRLVSVSLDGTVRMWDAHSGEALGQPLVGHTGAVRCVAWSADGRRLVSGSSDGTVRMWDAHSGEALGQPLVGHTGAVRCVAWSADGRRLVSVSLDGTVRMWDAHSGEALGQPLVGHTGAVRCVAWSADGRRLVSGSYDGTVRMWDAHSGEAVSGVLEHGEAVLRVGVDAQCSHIVSAGSSELRLWNVERAACEMTWADAAWQSTIDALQFTWSRCDNGQRKVIAQADDGSDVVVATCEGDVDHFGGRWRSRASNYYEFLELVEPNTAINGVGFTSKT